MLDLKAIRPSWWYSLVGLPLFVLGVGLFVYFLSNGITHVSDDLTQIVVPGEQKLTLRQPGTYTIFLEQQSVVNGRVYSNSDGVNGLTCKVTIVPANRDIPLRRASSSISYDVGGRSGRSVLEFQAKENGQYDVTCGYSEEAKGPQCVIAIGSGVGTRIGTTVARSLIAMFGGFGSAGAVVLVVFLLRDKSKKRLFAELNHAYHARLTANPPPPLA